MDIAGLCLPLKPQKERSSAIILLQITERVIRSMAKEWATAHAKNQQ
jgi:hypothetical protein